MSHGMWGQLNPDEGNPRMCVSTDRHIVARVVEGRGSHSQGEGLGHAVPDPGSVLVRDATHQVNSRTSPHKSLSHLHGRPLP